MRTLRLLGLPALTILIVALCGGNASATVFCKSNTTPCSSQVTAGTKVEMSLSGVSVMKAVATDECSGSEWSWKVESAGGTSTTVSGKVEPLKFSGCSCETKVLKNGEVEAHWISGTMNATATSKGAEVTSNCAGVDCVYGTGTGTSVGTLTGGEAAKLDVSATLAKVSGSFLCPSTSSWTATYEVKSPKPLYVAQGISGEGPTSTSLATSLSGEEKSGEELTVSEGSKVKDTATLSGTNASKASGTVKYKVYADKECKELVTSAGEVTVTSGSVPASEERTLEAGRVYYWQAEYSGDSNNLASTSTCGKEILTVKAGTSIATSLSGEEKAGEELTVNEGSKVKDTATLSGTKSSAATGKVKFKIYKDKECKELAAEAGEGSLSEGKASSEEKTLEAGALYYWQAEYPGDSLHLASTTTCAKEVLTVKAQTTLATSLRGEPWYEAPVEGGKITVPQGVYVADTASIEGTKASTATGTVKYSVYADAECKELIAEVGEGSVEGGNGSPSEEYELEEGTYYWKVAYEGDALHQASSSACGSEVLTIESAVTISSALAAGEETGDVVEVEEETSVTDSETLSGPKAATANGKVIYTVYSDLECKELVAEAGEVTVSEGKVPASEPVALEPGIYFWRAHYTGDEVNGPDTTECGETVMEVADDDVTLHETEAAGAALAIGSKVEGSAPNLFFQGENGVIVECNENKFTGEVQKNKKGPAVIKLTSWKFEGGGVEPGRCKTTGKVKGEAVDAVVTPIEFGTLRLSDVYTGRLERFEVKIEGYVKKTREVTCRFGVDAAWLKLTFGEPLGLNMSAVAPPMTRRLGSEPRGCGRWVVTSGLFTITTAPGGKAVVPTKP
jgi:hypothetical protein